MNFVPVLEDIEAYFSIFTLLNLLQLMRNVLFATSGMILFLIRRHFQYRRSQLGLRILKEHMFLLLTEMSF